MPRIFNAGEKMKMKLMRFKCFLPVLFFVFISFVRGFKPAEPLLGNKCDEETFKFAHVLEKKYGLQFMMLGEKLLFDSKDTMWGMYFVDNRKLTLEQIKPLIHAMIEDFYQMMLVNPMYVTCLEYLNRTYHCMVNDISPRRLGIKIAFWDENVDRPQYPYIATAKASEGVIYYYYSDPQTQALLKPITETFEEANLSLPPTKYVKLQWHPDEN